MAAAQPRAQRLRLEVLGAQAPRHPRRLMAGGVPRRSDARRLSFIWAPPVAQVLNDGRWTRGRSRGPCVENLALEVLGAQDLLHPRRLIVRHSRRRPAPAFVLSSL